MKLHEAVATALLDQGVDTVFGLIGDGNLYMMESFRLRGGRFVAVANESAAMLAASGYSTVTGRLGVATVTHGTGLANTVTSLIEGVKARIPGVLIAADTPLADAENFQDIPQRALVDACGAGFVQARSPELVVEDLAQAIHLAVIERRPVVLNIPIDFQWQEVEYAAQPVVALTRDAIGPDPERIEEAVGLLSTARRPLLLAGRGAVEARDALLALAGRIGAPVATTAKARQLFRGEEFDLGIFGGLATEMATEVILESDVVIAFGAGLNKWTTAEGSLFEGRRVIQVDVDASALGRNAVPDVGIQGDAALVAEALVAMYDEAGLPASAFAGKQLATRLRTGRATAEAKQSAHRARELEREDTGARPRGTLDLELAVRAVEQAVPSDRTLVIDAGRQCFVSLAVLSVEDPHRYVHVIHFGSIGVGMPYALGAAVGAPDRPTLLAVGDGAFMLGGITEFSTAVRNRLDLVVVVFDDDAFGAEYIQLYNKQIDPGISTFEWPDLGPVAESLGGAGVTVRTIAELDAALAALDGRDRGRPTLIDVKLSADEISRGGSGAH